MEEGRILASIQVQDQPRVYAHSRVILETHLSQMTLQRDADLHLQGQRQGIQALNISGCSSVTGRGLQVGNATL